jgi:uncharacterized damage-inducible protein DinB
MANGSRKVVDTLSWLIEQAFDGDPHQSLVANLRRLRESDWTALPTGGGRSVSDILEHVAWAKWMYTNFAFGPGDLRGDAPPLVPPGGARVRPRDELLSWLKEGQRRWLRAVRGLQDDAELERRRKTNWGEELPTRIIIQIMISHDVYHAGEINHLRAILQADDRWRY